MTAPSLHGDRQRRRMRKWIHGGVSRSRLAASEKNAKVSSSVGGTIVSIRSVWRPAARPIAGGERNPSRGRRSGQATCRSIRRGSSSSPLTVRARAPSRSRSGSAAGPPIHRTTCLGSLVSFRSSRVGDRAGGGRRQHHDVGAGAGGGVHDIGGRQVGAEIEHVGAGGRGEHRAAQQTEFVPLARRRGEQQPWTVRRAWHGAQQAAEHAADDADTRCSCAGRTSRSPIARRLHGASAARRKRSVRRPAVRPRGD